MIGKALVPFLILLLAMQAPAFAQTADLQKAATLYTSGKYEEAGKLFESIINAGNASKEVYSGAIDCALKLKQYGKASALTESALAKFGSNYDLELLQAQLYNQLGNTAKSISALEKTVKRYPDSTGLKITLSDLYTLRGSELYQNKKMEESAAALTTALRYNPKNPDARKNLIIIYLQEKKYKEALPYSKDAYRLFPNDKIIRQLYFETLIGLENFAEAVKVSEQIVKNSPDDIQAGLNNALLYRYNQEPQKALDKYAELRQKFPGSKEVYQAEISFLELASRYDTIIARYREFLVLNPGDKDMIIGLGKTYETRKSYDTARTVYSELIEKDIYRDAQLLIAETYVKENKNDTAISVYQKYLISGGKNPDAFTRINELLIKADRTAESREYLLRAVSVHPSKTEFTVSLAKSYYYGNQPDSAMMWLEKVKNFYLEFPEIPYITALIYLDRKDTSRALFQLTRAIKYSLEQTQKIQAQILGAVSGNNINNPDSVETAKSKGAELDAVTALLKDSFKRLKELQKPESYISTLKKLITDLPSAALLYLQRAKYLEETGSLTEAAEDYETALILSPSSDEVQMAAGNYYESRGENEKALIAFRKASSLNKKLSYPYSKIIDLAQKLGTLNEICDYWLKLYETDLKNSILREHLIEALHKAGRMKEAEKVINN